MKPMLAVKATEKQILAHLPLYASPKLDGIRCIIKGGVALSRSLKPIPNRYVQDFLSNRPDLEGFDGELGVGDPTANDFYRKTVSGVMSKDGTPDFTFYVFNDYTVGGAYVERHLPLLQISTPHLAPWPSILMTTLSELYEYESAMLLLGYEGLILRRPDSPYKFGRSTAKEGYLLKLKRFTDAEAVVIGMVELQHNGNEATTSETGYTQRSSHKGNKTGLGTLGALICKDVESEVEFKIGTGFDAATRQKIWDGRPPIGLIVKYKSFKIGVKDAPRHPVFLGWRSPADMS